MRGGKGAEQKSPLEVAAPWGISITADLFISISFVENLCYNWFAALPAHLFGRGGEKNGKYSFFRTVCRSKCSSLLYLQVA